MSMEVKKYHYTECGLDNVYLHNFQSTIDVDGEETICIKRINKLHHAIAWGLIEKTGMLKPAEIVFLRSLIGCTQAEFGTILGKDGQTVGRWERAECTQDKTTDTLIRVVSKDLLQLPTQMNSDELARRNAIKKECKQINIDAANFEYEPMKPAA